MPWALSARRIIVQLVRESNRGGQSEVVRAIVRDVGGEVVGGDDVRQLCEWGVWRLVALRQTSCSDEVPAQRGCAVHVCRPLRCLERVLPYPQ